MTALVGDVAATVRRTAITIDACEVADLERISIGRLDGFVDRVAYAAMLAAGRIPPTLALAPHVAAAIGDELALHDRHGRPWGTLRVRDIYQRDVERELDVLYGTRDPSHPGVAYTRSRPSRLAGGEVRLLPLPPDVVAKSYRRATGFIVWLTGMSGAGKSTLATALAAALGPQHLEILDGDEVRTHLSKGLGFSREDRDVNVHRIGYVARTLAQHGVGVVTAAISPYAETRRAVRQLAEARGIPVVEVHATAPLDELVRRDVKGLYARALAGEIEQFTGVTDPYEPPVAPDVEVRTDVETVAEGVAKIVAALRARGLVATGA
jgi:adenylylsulfate kinase